MDRDIIPVTKPFSPPIEEYQEFLRGIWDRNWLTNNGPLVTELESRLKSYLGVSNLVYVNNGTIALQLAIKALGIKKKVITTPFSYVATTSSLVWENCVPIYVDIDPMTCNIYPSRIEAAIDEDTQAILATHCFGNPCDVEAIQSIADKYDLKVIFDGAHCFGTKYKGQSIYNFGDICTASFHATKLFHTIEGGAVISNNDELNHRLSYMRNFGHDGPERFFGLGINGKNSEFHAAMGLINLRYVDEILAKKVEIAQNYSGLLASSYINVPNTKLEYSNHAYYPIILKNEYLLMKIMSSLEENGVFTRRYFYPSLTQLNYVEGKAPISEDLSKRILLSAILSHINQGKPRFYSTNNSR